MKPPAFRYLRAESVEHALELKAEHGDDARFLAGGQSLVPTMNFRLAQPAALIDLNGVGALAGVGLEGGALRLGAMTRNRVLERDATIARAQPLVAEAIACVAHPQIRNRGTIGGNLAHADPASEMPAVMLALDARLLARSVRGERRIAASDFFQGIFTTALAGDELLAAIEMPAPAPRTGTAFIEVARRQGDYPMAGVAAVVTLDANGACTGARLAYCNAGETARLAVDAAGTLVGSRIDEAAARAAAAAAQREIDPRGNVHASPAYQRFLADTLTRRTLALAAERARAS